MAFVSLGDIVAVLGMIDAELAAFALSTSRDGGDSLAVVDMNGLLKLRMLLWPRVCPSSWCVIMLRDPW